MADPNYIRSEAKSFTLLQRFGVESADFDVEDIAFAMGIEVRRGGLASGDAWLLRHEDGTGTIRLNASVTDFARERFSIAHEIGHWELHSNLTQGYLCTERNLRDYGQSAEEAEANWFAATLLMPKFLIPPEVFKRDPSFDYVRRLAKTFRTSLTAAARRFVELNRHPLVLVSSTGGRINWIARSKHAEYYFLYPGTVVPWNSLTAEFVLQAKAEQLTQSTVEILEPSVWFPNLNFDHDAELFEEVRYSVEYDTALTLLWIPR